MTTSTDPTAIAGCADLVYLSDLQHKPVEWLWQNRLAVGSLAMISGAPGSGKTWIALAIADQQQLEASCRFVPAI